MPLLDPPTSGVIVRMYRQGHGDCFLLATRGDDGKPVYLLIDCGLWSGSQLDGGPTIAEVVKDIADATGGRLDVLVITHEHEDHVMGFLTKSADGAAAWDAIKVDELWLAWTEDGSDERANELRGRFNDVLIGLAAAAERPEDFGLHGTAHEHTASLIRAVVRLHTGEEDPVALAAMLRPGPGLAANDPGKSPPGYSNKLAIKAMRDKAGRVRFLAPERGPEAVPRVAAMRAFALGPPRDKKLLSSLDPWKGEGFGLDGAARTFLGALDGGAEADRPFGRRHGTAPATLAGEDKTFFQDHYGTADDDLATWRRIDGDWAEAAESLALRLNDEVNNTSLVLAFELPRTKKVLLFTGDAQRGSWVSWGELGWGEGASRVTAKDLLGRVALYKVGHHGSHNATLKGRADDAHPNLSWLGHGDAGEEFVAFIPANKPWAYEQKPHPWRHPLEDIEEALVAKAGGRVIRLDADKVEKPEGIGAIKWKQFLDRTRITKDYAEHIVPD